MLSVPLARGSSRLIGGTLGLAGASYLYAKPVGAAGIPCPIHAATGYWCPGCGATRMTQELLHANISGAIQYNALLVAATPLLLLFAFNALPRRSGARAIARWIYAPRSLVLVGVAVVAFTVGRNTEAFAFLAP